MVAQSVADILSHHVKLSVEGIDRMYLNVYVPKLQHDQGIVWFFRNISKTRGGQPEAQRWRTRSGSCGTLGKFETVSLEPR